MVLMTQIVLNFIKFYVCQIPGMKFYKEIYWKFSGLDFEPQVTLSYILFYFFHYPSNLLSN
jgi:hypothetical protein